MCPAALYLSHGSRHAHEFFVCAKCDSLGRCLENHPSILLVNDVLLEFRISHPGLLFQRTLECFESMNN